MRPEHVDIRAPCVGTAGGERENSTRLVVHEDDFAASRNRQHPVAHIGNHVTEKRVAETFGLRTWSSASRGTARHQHTRFGDAIANAVPHPATPVALLTAK